MPPGIGVVDGDAYASGPAGSLYVSDNGVMLAIRPPIVKKRQAPRRARPYIAASSASNVALVVIPCHNRSTR